MRISLDWLKTLIPTDKPAAEIGALLTGSGLEVESLEELESIPGGLRGVVLGTVLTCAPHPDADKLSLTTVDVGDGVPRQIVCGAPCGVCCGEETTSESAPRPASRTVESAFASLGRWPAR